MSVFITQVKSGKQEIIANESSIFRYYHILTLAEIEAKPFMGSAINQRILSHNYENVRKTH